MSNMAAGVTIGSNHNSRANDGEIRAGRGFWPGLSVSLKHPCRFASFTFIAKGDYPYELNITLPFSLVNNNVHLDRLEVMPAYFWMYNLYALERNSWKATTRDRRKIKKQHIETDYLAPDTVEEIITALSQIEGWMKAAGLPLDNEKPESDPRLEADALPADGLERYHRNTVILKPRRARAAYREMLLYYALKTFIDYLDERPELSYTNFIHEIENCKPRISEWVNLGGQITPAFRVDELRRKIGNGEINGWEEIHAFYDEMKAAYPLDRLRHAWFIYNYLNSDRAGRILTKAEYFKPELETFVNLSSFIAEQVYASRAKDFSEPFRSITYRNREEMEQVVGNADDNSFVKHFREKVSFDKERARKLIKRL
jgi:hypothetical protein